MVSTARRVLCTVAFLLVALNTAMSVTLTGPTLVFKMTADKTALLPGESSTAHVWAWIYDPAGIEQPDNGLAAWQLDLSVDNTGVISIVPGSINMLAPVRNPALPPWDVASLNNPVTGELRKVAISALDPTGPSTVGVGHDLDITHHANYSEIFNFTVQASLSPLHTTATYTIMNDGAGWFGILPRPGAGTYFDSSDPEDYGDTCFYTEGSDNVFTIVPEPGTLLLLSAMTVLSLRRRGR